MTDETMSEDGLIRSAPSTIFTYSGGSIDPINPSLDDICIQDIAHALSQQCRWTGHTKLFYSVAEHCVHVSYACPPAYALDGLLHDASEAYLSDLARPIKKSSKLGDAYMKVERGLEDAIAKRFGIGVLAELPKVRLADEAMLWQEAKHLMPHLFSAANRKVPEGTPEVVCWSPMVAEIRFLERFAEIVNMPDGWLKRNLPPISPIETGTKVLPVGSRARKDIPLVTGVLDYFPAALAAVASVSKAGNDKHNPGEPLHWARGKSADQADALGRHLLERGSIDPDTGMRHSAQLAWRALALLQVELEEAGEAPLARGATAA